MPVGRKASVSEETVETPFQIVYVVRLVPGQRGYREETDLQVHLWPGFLEKATQIDPQDRARVVMVHLALILNAHPLEGEELEELVQLGLATAADRGHLVAGMTNLDIERETGISRKIVPRLCRKLEQLGWLSTRVLEGGVRRRAGRFDGDRIYLVRAGSEILYTSPGAGSGDLPEEQAIYPAPCPPTGHGGSQQHASRRNFSPTVSSEGTRSVPPGDTVCPLGGHGEANMEREKGKMEGVTTTPGVVAAASPLSLKEEPPFQAASSWIGLAADMLAALDHIARYLGERFPDGDGEGRPASLLEYEAGRELLSILSSPLSLATVSREVPADLVENLTVLACSLHAHGLAGLLQSVECALGQAGEVAALSLESLWPHVAGAEQLKLELRQMLREGGQLPNGGSFRHARKLFILLNRFEPGMGLLRQFTRLCQELGVKPVHAVLKRALREGRGYVTMPFLKDGVARWQEGQRERCQGRARPGQQEADCPAAGEENPGTEGLAEEATPAHQDTSVLRGQLADYGITEPALSELAGMDPAAVRGWMLYLEGQRRLSPEERRCILVRRLRDGHTPPAEWLGLARLGPEQEAWLEAGYLERRVLGQWPAGLEAAGLTPTLAEQWYHLRRANDRE